MSEHIKMKQHRFGNYNKPFTQKPQDGASDDEAVSKEAHKSEVTKVSQVAVVSPALPVPETSRSIKNFSMCYDHLFAEFKDELVAEYAQMRGCYMSEYQENYDQNTSRKDGRVTDMQAIIQAQIDYIKEMHGIK